MGNGHYCYPLTLTDGFSRFLLGCQGLSSARSWRPKRSLPVCSKNLACRSVFALTTVSFATNTLARLSQLSAWWVRLGLLPECIEPGKPPQNGRHERMHRTLKAETTRPPGATCAPSSRSSTTSATSSTMSDRMKRSTCAPPPPACTLPRAMPDRLPPLESPDRFEVR